MITLETNIPSSKVQVLKDALGYKEEINGEANPEGAKAFAERLIKQFLNHRVVQYNQRQTTSEDITLE